MLYVVMPNQLGIDTFDLKDALLIKKNHLCSDDLKEFIEKNHLCLNLDDSFNASLVHLVHMMIQIMFTTHHVIGLLDVI